MDRLLYPVPELPEKLGIGLTKSWEKVRSGEIESVRIDGRVLVPAEALDAYIERLRSKVAS